MIQRLVVILCLLLLGFGLAGCTKCGWVWEQGSRSCQPEQAR